MLTKVLKEEMMDEYINPNRVTVTGKDMVTGIRPADSIGKLLFGKDRREVIANNECMTCELPNLDFKDGLSVKEYQISGMCQDCQDKVFE